MTQRRSVVRPSWRIDQADLDRRAREIPCPTCKAPQYEPCVNRQVGGGGIVVNKWCHNSRTYLVRTPAEHQIIQTLARYQRWNRT